mmetsp:Transcript_77911/g.241501  ORF Transcript_77911/g.241501 Transcript_77911/m.241501 type:complete len:226 (+) Transcript_77911:462-1139(+)
MVKSRLLAELGHGKADALHVHLCDLPEVRHYAAEDDIHDDGALIYLQLPLPKAGSRTTRDDGLADRIFDDVTQRTFLVDPKVQRRRFQSEEMLNAAREDVAAHIDGQLAALRLARKCVLDHCREHDPAVCEEDVHQLDGRFDSHRRQFLLKVEDVFNSLFVPSSCPAATPPVCTRFCLAGISKRGMATGSNKSPRPHGSGRHGGSGGHEAPQGFVRGRDGKHRTT